MSKKVKIIIITLGIILLPIAILFFLITSQDDIKNSGLRVGESAPNFEGMDQNANLVSLDSLTQTGPVVLIFYRGYWCPYCNKHLSQLQDSLQMIVNMGASVVAIAPELPENVAKTITKTHATFPVLSDKNLEIMKLYKVDFVVGTGKSIAYGLFGIDFEEINSLGANTLPVPATYIIDKYNKIQYVHFNPDYKSRESIAGILRNLE